MDASKAETFVFSHSGCKALALVADDDLNGACLLVGHNELSNAACVTK